MTSVSCMLPPEERVKFTLRALYERYDYQPYRMSQFEEYSLYAENRSFLQSPRVITFTDLDGRMMALKPDVTLSIVRHAPAKPRTTEKLYYTENVFRPSAQSRAFKEISQMGVEAVGCVDLYQMAEVVRLAAMSLAAISKDALLELSHVRFTAGLFDSLGLTGEPRARALAALSAKNLSALSEAAAQASLSPEDTAALCALPTLYGPAEETLKAAQMLVRTDDMCAALGELRRILAAVSCEADFPGLQLDFSIVGDTDYYSGLMMRGYIAGLPRAVLLGGRYDNILKKLGKGGGGIGFALDLSEIARLPVPSPQSGIDLLIRYKKDCDVALLLACVSRETEKGLRVRALPEEEDAGDLRFARCMSLDAYAQTKGGGQ